MDYPILAYLYALLNSKYRKHFILEIIGFQRRGIVPGRVTAHFIGLSQVSYNTCFKSMQELEKFLKRFLTSFARGKNVVLINLEVRFFRRKAFTPNTGSLYTRETLT